MIRTSPTAQSLVKEKGRVIDGITDVAHMFPADKKVAIFGAEIWLSGRHVPPSGAWLCRRYLAGRTDGRHHLH